MFISSETDRTGDGESVHVLFPPDAFSTHDKDELMRLTLNSFTMRRNFYAINEHNNVFYSGADTFTKTNTHTIAPGDCTVSDLSAALQT